MSGAPESPDAARAPGGPKLPLIALFGPNSVGKTGVAVELAELLRGRGEDPVAIACDSIQVYRGLGILSGAATPAERQRLEHRLIGFADPREEFSAGRFAELARAEIDACLGAGRRVIVVGGTGLYLRAALSELELRPPVSEEIRAGVERELSERGSEALHAELPPEQRDSIDPADSKRVGRATELIRAGEEPQPPDGGQLWTARLRHPTLLVGLTRSREQLAERIEARVEAMLEAGVEDEVRAVEALGAARTVRTAHGYRELLDGDLERWKTAQRRYGRRQMTWMRKMEGVELIDRSDLSDTEVAKRIAAMI